jgi:hypothetical protein
VIGDALTTSPSTWDTNGLEEGEYEVRLTAGDEHAVGADGLHDEMISGPVVVDHTPPALSGLECSARGHEVLVRGVARDGGLYVSKAEVAIGNEDWVPASAADGLWDGPTERFETRLTEVPAGSYPVRVRVADAAGNVAVVTERVIVRP